MLGFSFFLTSCASKVEETGGVSSSTSKAPEQGLAKYMGGYKMVKDKETGMMKPVSDKEGPFSGASNPFSGTNNAGNKEFSTAEYDSRRWNGTKNKSVKEWNNANKNYEYSPEFIRQNSRYADSYAREGSASYNQSSESYETASAYEQSGERIARDLDYRVQKRREVYVQPEIIDNKSQQSQSGRSVEDVKSLLND